MSDLPRIHIEQQAAQLGIHTTYAKVEATTPRPKMRIISEPPRMEVERKQPTFKVETQQYSSPARVDRPVLSKRHQHAAATTHQRPSKHSLDAPADSNHSAIPKTGLAHTAAPASLELNKELLDAAATKHSTSQPQNMPSIVWEAGYMNISWSKAQMQIEWDKNYLPSFSVEPHSVEIFLREKPYIKITVSDEVIEAMYGPQINQEV